LSVSSTSLIVPANKKMYFIFNNTSGGFAVTVKVSGQTGILVANGKKVILTCNGTDIVEAHTAIVGNATMGGTLGVTGAGTFSSTLGVTGAISGTGADNTIILSRNGATQWRINNSNAGTGALANLLLQNGTTVAGVYLPGTGYTSVGAFAANAAILYGNNAAGVALVADSGPVKIAGGGTTTVATISSALLAVTGAATVSTTLGVTGAGSIEGLTVGRGAGAVSTNTAVGASALAANTTATANTAVGYQAGYSNTTGTRNSAFGKGALYSNLTGGLNTAVGEGALYANTAGNNTAIGVNALLANTSGDSNTAVGRSCLNSNTTGAGLVGMGYAALDANTTGSYNTALGQSALQSNTTASNNTAVGFQAGYSNTTGEITAVGIQALYANTTGTQNTAVGIGALYPNTTGGSNSALGRDALNSNTTGSSNTAMGQRALYNNTTASNNTAVGYHAAYSNTTGGNRVSIGYRAGYSSTTTANGVYVGSNAGFSTTGSGNCFIGSDAGTAGSGYYVTTGVKNTILGAYDGNMGSLDIRTASNYVVLSDGDGNPRGYFDSSGIYYVLGTHGQILCGTTTSSGSFGNSTGGASISFYGATHATVPNKVTVIPGTNGVFMNSGATAWTAISDERFKDIIEPISDAVTKVSSLRAVIGKFKTDEKNVRRSFLIAQDVQAVLPEAIDATNPDQLGVAYTDVIPLLVAAIKELTAKVTALEAK